MKTLIVKDMMCQNCQKKIEKALGRQDIICEVNLETKEVSVEDSEVEVAISIIKSLGFKVS